MKMKKTKNEPKHFVHEIKHTYSSLEQSETKRDIRGYGEKLSSEGEMFQFMCVPIFYLLFSALAAAATAAVSCYFISLNFFCLRLFMWFVCAYCWHKCTFTC